MPSGVSRSCGDGQAGRCQHGVVAAVGIAAEERILQIEAARQAEHDVGVGARLADGRDDGGPQLHAAQAVEAAVEAGAQAFALPRGGDGQHDVGIARGGVEEEIGVDVEVERLQRRFGLRGVGLRDEQVGAERDQHAHGIGLALEHGAVDVARGDPAAGEAGAERALVQAERLGALRGR